jgi:hypothetical protein
LVGSELVTLESRAQRRLPLKSAPDLAALTPDPEPDSDDQPGQSLEGTTPAPVDGVVHVLGVTRDGEIRKYPKLRDHVKTLRPAT